jgi:hypothetical protein
MTDARQIQLQRLVDGQLSRPHIKQMLTEAQSNNELWRDIAVAFVEDQIFEREVCLSVAEPSKTSDCPIDSRASGSQSNGSMYSHLRWMTAATLLVALSLGFVVGRFNSTGIGPGGSVGREFVVNQPVNSWDVRGDDDGPTQIKAPFSAQVVDNEGNVMSRQRIPLIPESMAREYGVNFSPEEVPQSVQSQFNRVGYEIKPNVEYYEGRTNDGRVVVMPVQNYKVRSYGQ